MLVGTLEVVVGRPEDETVVSVTPTMAIVIESEEGYWSASRSRQRRAEGEKTVDLCRCSTATRTKQLQTGEQGKKRVLQLRDPVEAEGPLDGAQAGGKGGPCQRAPRVGMHCPLQGLVAEPVGASHRHVLPQ